MSGQDTQSQDSQNDAGGLRQTPLYALHQSLGAQLVPFAGYRMPLHYRDGILAEHRHTRAAAGLFDVSHMGQIRLRGAGAAAALERLVPADVVGLARWRQVYALFTAPDGGILDDLMIARGGDDDTLLLVVNAACREQDLEHLRRELAGRCDVEPLDGRALLALQGPQAEAALAGLAADPAALTALRFMHTAELELAGVDVFVSRSGYTGEDGFELSLAAEAAPALAERLLAQPGVAPVGLGARDSLRLEAGLCLYGHDIDRTTTPVEARLAWSIGKSRRQGERRGGFPGAERILDQLEHGAGRYRVGLRVRGRAPLREGAELFTAARTATGQAVGRVTSGGFGPSLGAPLAMAYVDAEHAALGGMLRAPLRARELELEVVRLPFVATHYRR